MDNFSLLIKPASADCNLRCKYCFYLGKGNLYPENIRHRMPDEVLRRIIKTFLATGQQSYTFGWQGGEPTLMGVEFFRKVTAYQKEYAAPGSIISNGLQTNGTLLDDEWAEHLAKYKFLVGISIDGPPEIHNYHRVYSDGRKTHSDVLRGLATLNHYKVEYNILTLVSQSNINKPREVFRYLSDIGIRFHQYIECVEFDDNGTLMPFAITGKEWGNFLCAIYDEWIIDPYKVSIRLFDNILAKIVNGVDSTCTIGTDCRHYLVVEHNGDIYPCDFFVEPDLLLGNIMNDSWHKIRKSELYKTFGKRKSQWNKQCTSCEYLEFCAGCCPKNRETRGCDPTRLSVLCEGWKMFYKHALPGLKELAAEIMRNQLAASRAQSVQTSGNRLSGKIGRNDPCPCGSGKKYKKCCGHS